MTTTSFDHEGVSYEVRPRTIRQRDAEAPTLHSALLRKMGYDPSNIESELNPLVWDQIVRFVQMLQTTRVTPRPEWLPAYDAALSKLMAGYEAFRDWCNDNPAWVDQWEAALKAVEGGAGDDPKEPMNSET